MTAPNMFIVHVTDPATAARFYGNLFDIAPSFETPGFVAFDLDGDVKLALWKSPSGLDPAAVRTSEVCLTLPGNDLVQAEYRAWKDKGVRIVTAPREEVYGLTFVAADLDGNLIRVAPVD